MKELSTEQKAKAYDKVREKITLRFGSNVTEEIFSEFEMSEDEKIRKQILSFLKEFERDHYRNIDFSSWIAWLEKQDNKSKLETASKEQKFKVKYASSEYNVLEIKEIAGVTYYGIEDEPNHIDYILSDNCEIVRDHSYGVKEKGSPHPTRTAIFSEQSHAWSKEDEKEVAVLEAYIYSKDWSDRHIDRALGIVDELVNKLKSLKSRVQPQQEWSEEDENGLSDALWAIKQAKTIAKDENDMGNLWYAENWLKSLKQRIGG